ncbi:aminotransferase class I/II-fold pyridoxal phosphate-dependent enzyme [Anaerofustis stercorihominis]|uniref:threonine aldolase family protein n=2 Tax=Anaerofustis stercorihominis TaxID=214853 RepID=UPI0039841A09
MYSFTNDYSEGAHKNILAALIKTNFEQASGYGTDHFCEEAANMIKGLVGNEDSSVHFLAGGTGTNTAAISAFLRAHEGVIAPKSGHINVHESGAIEAVGHKIIQVEETNGKLTAGQVEEIAKAHYEDEEKEHTVKPKMVYISNPTEEGTIYYKDELIKLREVCDKYDMFLYVDGARLGSALTSVDNDLTLKDLGSLTDAFYIGGTKMGALFGEALVINNKDLNVDFRYHIKQNGGMLAKGRLIGVQFIELFKDNLYFEIGKHENKLANRLALGVGNLGYGFNSLSSTNQIFPILPNDILKVLSKKYSFALWEKLNEEQSVIRLCTSFATSEKMVDEFIKDLAKLTFAKEKLLKELEAQKANEQIVSEPEELEVKENESIQEVPVELKETLDEKDIEVAAKSEPKTEIQDETEVLPQEEKENNLDIAYEDEEVIPIQTQVIEETQSVILDEEITEPVNENISEVVQPKKAVVEEFIPMEEENPADSEKFERVADNEGDIFADVFKEEKNSEVFESVKNDVTFKKDDDLDIFSEFEFED